MGQRQLDEAGCHLRLLVSRLSSGKGLVVKSSRLFEALTTPLDVPRAIRLTVTPRG